MGTVSFNNSNFTSQTPSRLINTYIEGLLVFQERKNLVDDMNGSMVITKAKVNSQDTETERI